MSDCSWIYLWQMRQQWVWIGRGPDVPGFPLLRLEPTPPFLPAFKSQQCCHVNHTGISAFVDMSVYICLNVHEYIFPSVYKARMQNSPTLISVITPTSTSLSSWSKTWQSRCYFGLCADQHEAGHTSVFAFGECEVALQWEVSHGITLAVGRAREWAQTVTRVILGGNLRVELCGAGKGSARGGCVPRECIFAVYFSWSSWWDINTDKDLQIQGLTNWF